MSLTEAAPESKWMRHFSQHNIVHWVLHLGHELDSDSPAPNLAIKRKNVANAVPAPPIAIATMITSVVIMTNSLPLPLSFL